ncbi:MAG: hypothetical protein AB7K24_04215 [Gemmataceae bacterium]
MDENSPVIHEVETLTWLLIDQEISPAQFDRLEELMATNPAARQRYQSILQLDTLLHAHFAALKQPAQVPPDARAA